MSYLLDFQSALKNKPYFILDTETTGLDSSAEICQIAIINSEGDTLLDTLVKPLKPIPNDAIAIHGITNAMVEDAPTWEELTTQIYNILTGQTVVIYNVSYDLSLMNQSSDEELNEQWNDVASGWYCAMEAYAEYHGEVHHYYGTYVWQSLSVAADMEDIPVANAHNALGDCIMTLGVTKALLKEASNG